MDAAECKDVVRGLIFVKYVSDAFEAHRAKLGARGAVTLMAAIAMFDALCRMATVARNLHGA